MKALGSKTKKALVAFIAICFFMSFLTQVAHAAYGSCDNKSSPTVEICFQGSSSKEKEKTADIKDDYRCCITHGHINALQVGHLASIDISLNESIRFFFDDSLVEETFLKELFRPPRSL
mgnify:CR=1 FL=1|jgi:hypothetical protein